MDRSQRPRQKAAGGARGEVREVQGSQGEHIISALAEHWRARAHGTTGTLAATGNASATSGPRGTGPLVPPVPTAEQIRHQTAPRQLMSPVLPSYRRRRLRAAPPDRVTELRAAPHLRLEPLASLTAAAVKNQPPWYLVSISTLPLLPLFLWPPCTAELSSSLFLAALQATRITFPASLSRSGLTVAAEGCCRRGRTLPVRQTI